MKRLYHASAKHLGHLVVFHPRVPKGRAEYEDSDTPRVCLSSSVKGCFLATGHEGDYFYLYVLDRPVDLLYPVWRDELWWIHDDIASNKEVGKTIRRRKLRNVVSDVNRTGEIWALGPTQLSYLGYFRRNLDDDVEYLDPVSGDWVLWEEDEEA